MSDWVDSLDDEQRREWDAFVEHVRKDAVTKIADSAFVISLVPDHVDVKFAVELGLAIMLDKPIIAVTMPGADVPPKLRQIADEVIAVDIDIEEGRRRLAAVIDRITGMSDA